MITNILSKDNGSYLKTIFCQYVQVEKREESMSKEKDNKKEKLNFQSEELILSSIKQKLADQFSLVQTLDQKSAIIVALDAGILAFANLWNEINSPDWLDWIIAPGLVFISVGLSFSLLAVFTRKLFVYPGMREFWTKYRKKPLGESTSYLTNELIIVLLK